MVLSLFLILLSLSLKSQCAFYTPFIYSDLNYCTSILHEVPRHYSEPPWAREGKRIATFEKISHRIKSQLIGPRISRDLISILNGGCIR